MSAREGHVAPRRLAARLQVARLVSPAALLGFFLSGLSEVVHGMAMMFACIIGALAVTASTLESSSAPTTRSSRWRSIVNDSQTGGSLPGGPAIFPARPSALLRDGSSSVPSARRPPGFATPTAWPPLMRLVIVVVTF